MVMKRPLSFGWSGGMTALFVELLSVPVAPRIVPKPGLKFKGLAMSGKEGVLPPLQGLLAPERRPAVL
jgi:hypothetical protein